MRDTELDQAGGCEIERIYMTETMKGQGFGRQLFKQTVSYGVPKEAKYIRLGVGENNKNALLFYEKTGMKPFGKHICQLGDDPQTDILMKCLIS